jgi:branched-chain amino acid transport system substrate-binding protein
MDEEPKQQDQPVTPPSVPPSAAPTATSTSPLTPPPPEVLAPAPPPPLNEPQPEPLKRPGRKLLVSLGVFTAVIVVVLGAFFIIQLNTKPAAPHIKVGVMMAFSGGSSSMGYGAMKGVQLAKKQLSADNIDIIQMDSKCDAKTAGEAIKSLIAQKVVAIIGEGCSSASVAALPAANNAKIPMISPSASSPTLSIPDDYFFRVVPPDNFQGSFMAQAIYDRDIRKVAVFYTNEPYGSGMNTVFREKFEALGGEVVATAFAEPDVIDLNTQMKTLEAAEPEAVFIAPNSVVSATAAMKLAREAGIEAPFFGADIMYDNTIISNNPSVAEGLTISSFPTGTKAFKQSLVNEYGKSEQLYAAPQAYDIIHILQLAVQKGATTGEQIKNILPSISLNDSVSGFKQFDNNGEVSDKNYKYDLFQVKDGAFVLVE